MEPDYKEAARKLWMLLDDIDTLDDACRADDAAFRKHTRDTQRKRFNILSGEQMDVLLSSPLSPINAGDAESALGVKACAGGKN